MRFPTANKNCYRRDEIGKYVVSTVRLPVAWEEALGAKYETLVYSCLAGAWDLNGDGVHSETTEEADVAHDAACTRIRESLQ